MRPEFLRPGRMLVALIVVLCVLAPVAVGSQTSGTAAWTPPVTPWGDPDLQGIYNFATATPLERAPEFGERATVSEEEWVAWQEKAQETITTDNRPPGVIGNYNDHWFDQARKKLTADRRTSLIVDPPNGRIPPTVPATPEKEDRRAALAAAAARFESGTHFSHLDMAMDERCIVRTDRAPYFQVGYNNSTQIFQSPGYVVILVEMIHSARVIPLDGQPHLGKNLPQWLGSPRGRWEGNTLVVETMGFPPEDGVTYRLGNPHGEIFHEAYGNPTFRLVERFTRVDEDTVEYEFTVSDPQTWTRPWTARVPWNRMDEEDPSYQLYEYACAEDNYDAVFMLKIARSQDRIVN